MKNKRGIFSFVWLFAIFAGIAILILSIYGAVKVTRTQEFVSDTEIAKQLTILTDPIEAGFAQTTTATLSLPGPTRIRNICGSINFGHNYLSSSTYNRKKWSAYGVETKTSDKYIFSEEIIEGEKIHIISEKFSYPYKVSDVLVMVPDTNTYCFNNAPEEIKTQIDSWRIDTLIAGNCSENDKAIQVCFESSKCDIGIYGACKNCESKYEYGTIMDERSVKKYVEGLMFAALFSDSENYDCNIERLMYRTSKVAQVFIDRIPLASSRDCSSNLGVQLINFRTLTENATSQDLPNLKVLADELDNRASLEVCRPW